MYETRWKNFVGWCESHEIVPDSASIPQVADFLLWLFRENKSVSTIKGHRTAIAKVLLLQNNVDISNDLVLSDLISSFEHERPRAVVEFPKWNLSLVLQTLCKKPFEPLHLASTKLLSYKTVFLLALASGARRG